MCLLCTVFSLALLCWLLYLQAWLKAETEVVKYLISIICLSLNLAVLELIEVV